MRDYPPAADEVEVSIFGPGRGESILVHIGGGKWITIDSCLNSRTRSSPALDYLHKIGVDVATDVLFVVATHAHDDHTAGISHIFRAAQSAQFVTSAAFTSVEFFASVDADQEIEKQINQTVRREFREVFAEARGRGGRIPHPIIRATEQRLIFNAQTWTGGPVVTIRTLSPSDTAVDRALQNLATGSAKAGHRRRLSAGDPNEYSVGIWVEVGEQAMLFGGDLLVGPSGCGWGAVCHSHHSAFKASLVKVPHHGSKNAHHDPMWTQFVDDAGIALLSPFRNGSRTIPQQTDLERIAGLTSGIYVSANPVEPAPSKAVKDARRRLPQFAKSVRERDGLPGHVLARRKVDATQWSVDHYDPAVRITSTR